MAYGPPPGYTPPPAYGVPPVRVPRRLNSAGLVVASIGVAAALIGGLLPWYGVGGQDGIEVADIVRGLSAGDTHGGTKAWLSWALWAVLALAAVAAVFANVPGRFSGPLRVVGPILAVVGVGGTLAALNDLVGGSGSITDHSQVGLWLVLLGLAAVGVAAIMGPRPIRTMPYGMPYPGAPYPSQY